MVKSQAALLAAAALFSASAPSALAFQRATRTHGRTAASLTRVGVTYDENKRGSTSSGGMEDDGGFGAHMRDQNKAVHPFGAGEGTRAADGADLKWLLGGKGANLAEMAALGLPVPPGFTITAATCSRYHAEGGSIPIDVWEDAMLGLRHIETAMNARLGDKDAPLLLSVRSGAAVSMPGMMDTVLNLGLNDDVTAALAAKTNNPRFAYDSFRRFLNMFGDVVLGIEHSFFEEKLFAMRADRGVASDTDLTADDLKELCQQYKDVYIAHGMTFPDNPLDQLRLSVAAVFDSWQSERALKYMEINDIKGLLGTAVNVQAMVFGNIGDTSGTGVCFTRNPNDGAPELYGEYLINAQGEDVVAGIRTPEPIARMEQDMPEVYEELLNTCKLLETHFADMQDIEFTVQEKKLYMLQTRAGKRNGAAAVQIACDLFDEGLVPQRRALQMVTPDHLDQMLHPQFKDTSSAAYKESVVGHGLPASPGAAVGVAAFSAAKAEELVKEQGIKNVILVRDETSPEDVGGMHAALGMLTSRGGMTSHAAVVARGWGKPCVVGASDLEVGATTATLASGATFKEGDVIAINGNTGEVLLGEQDLKDAELTGSLARFMGWADNTRRLRVLANADTPEDAAVARKNGAQGIGLVRTEHMFFDEARLASVRRMILAQSPEEKATAITELLPEQRKDFEGIFEAMDGLPVTVRLLDPPLHEFLPCEDECDLDLAMQLGLDEPTLVDAVEKCKEQNPMLGLRGCRLGITSPEIIEMQARAIYEAAVANKKKGQNPRPEVMIPLVGTLPEFRNQEEIVRRIAEQVFAEMGAEVPVIVGTMVETPRAALTAAKIATAAEFFSFGTNDLTQMTFGYSRDDAGTFLPHYVKNGVLPYDPFQVFDTEGVGQLVNHATAQGRAVRPGMKIGICGEHGGDPQSVTFFHGAGLDYVSCSAFRVPIARLAAAQAVVSEEQ
uniref:Pyruvate, phosphate dikinase n=1 Tax=Phaeomonas parva TaxID=124430 RepID=A0A7S1XU87_9STRA|mmetsp:Transcript_37749/g.118184  ORF Transcript_37749/g.118184 Transcript_37749/m.118184 type:complete len:954 (+) Transcript_37749:368-3229(+)